MAKAYYWLSTDDAFTSILDLIRQHGGEFTPKSPSSDILDYGQRREFLVTFPSFGPIIGSGDRIDREHSIGGSLYLPYRIPEGIWSTGELHLFGTAAVQRACGFSTVARAFDSFFAGLHLVANTLPSANPRFHPFEYQLFLINYDRKLFAFPAAFSRLSAGDSFFEHGSATTQQTLRTLQLRGYFAIDRNG